MLVNGETHAQNVGNIDRVARIVAGLALLSLLPKKVARFREMKIKVNRRSVLSGVGGALAGAALAKFSVSFAANADDVLGLPFANGERPVVRYPGERPLIRLTARPPQL